MQLGLLISLGVYVLVALIVARSLAGHFAWAYIVKGRTTADGRKAPNTFDWFGGWLQGALLAWAWLPIALTFAVYWLIKQIPVYHYGNERKGIELLRQEEHDERCEELEVPIT